VGFAELGSSHEEEFSSVLFTEKKKERRRSKPVEVKQGEMGNEVTG
jgi:hypothetical protein